MPERQQSSAEMSAYHSRSLGAGPPTAILAAIAKIKDAAVARAERRRSSGPPASPACADDDDDGLDLDMEDSGPRETVIAA